MSTEPTCCYGVDIQCGKRATHVRQFMTGGTLRQHLCAQHAKVLAGNLNPAWLYFRIAGDMHEVEINGRLAERGLDPVFSNEDASVVGNRAQTQGECAALPSVALC